MWWMRDEKERGQAKEVKQEEHGFKRFPIMAVETEECCKYRNEIMYESVESSDDVVWS